MIEFTYNADIEFNDEQTFEVTFEKQEEFVMEFTYADAKSKDEYMGVYEVTPTEEEQILETADKVLTKNVKINPIPKNYGLITWNGSVLTVS